MASNGRPQSERPPYREPPPPYTVEPQSGARPRTAPLEPARDTRTGSPEASRGGRSRRRRSESPPGTGRKARGPDRRRGGDGGGARSQRRERREKRGRTVAVGRSHSAGRPTDDRPWQPYLIGEASCPSEPVAGAEAADRSTRDRPDGVVWSSAKSGPLVALPRVPPSELEDKFRKTKAFKYGRRKLVLRGGLRRPVLEVVERRGSVGDPDQPPSRPARASGRHGRGPRRSHQPGQADPLPLKKTPPPRPPPPNLQAALGSPPSYEETLQMDSAAAGRLVPSSSSGNPFLIGGSLAAAPADRPPLQRDLSSPALPSADPASGPAAGGSVSRQSSARSSVDSASRRSSATPSVDSVSTRSEATPTSEVAGSGVSAPDGGGDPGYRGSTGAACGDPVGGSPSSDGAAPPEADVTGGRTGYNPFLSSADDERGSAEREGPAAVTAPPRHCRAGPAQSSAARDTPVGSSGGRPGQGSPPAAVWAGSSLSAARSDSEWAGRVSRTSAEQRSSPFCRDGPGRTAHHGAPFGRETVWAGRVSRTTADPPREPPTRASSSSLTCTAGPSDAGPTAGNSRAAVAPTSSPSASPSVSRSTSPTDSASVSPPPSPSTTPPGSPVTSRPASSAVSVPPAPSSSAPRSPMVLTVHTTVSHDSADDSASHTASDSAGDAPSQPAVSLPAASPSPSAGLRSSGADTSARSSATSLDRAGLPSPALDRTSSPTATSSLPNGGATAAGGPAAENGPSAETVRPGRLSIDTAAQTNSGVSASAAASEAAPDAADCPPLDWGLPIDPVLPDTPQAVALYDFHSSAPGDLNFKTGDCLVLLRRVTADWLLCRLGGRHGLVPAHHVRETVPLLSLETDTPQGQPTAPDGQPITPDGQLTTPDGQLTTPDGQPTTPDGQRVMALYDFEPQEKYDLGFKAGDMLVVIGRLNNDWGYGSRRGVSGQFPLSYVDVAVDTVPII